MDVLAQFSVVRNVQSAVQKHHHQHEVILEYRITGPAEQLLITVYQIEMKSTTTDRHANARDRKRANEKKMVVDNRSIFTIQEVIGKKAKLAENFRPRTNRKTGKNGGNK